MYGNTGEMMEAVARALSKELILLIGKGRG